MIEKVQLNHWDMPYLSYVWVTEGEETQENLKGFLLINDEPENTHPYNETFRKGRGWLRKQDLCSAI